MLRFGLAMLLALFLPTLGLAEESPKRIGIIAPLTGTGAVYGTAIRRGIELAREDNPDLFKSLEFVFEDSQYDNKTAVTVFNKLRMSNNIDLVYVFGHGQSHTVAPLAESAKIPLVACTGEKDIAADKEYIIRFFVPHEWLGSELLKYLRTQGHSHFAIVSSQFSFLQNILRGFKAQLKPNEQVEIVEDYLPQDRDFAIAIAKLKKGKQDAVGVFLGQGQVGVFFKTAGNLHLKGPFFGTHAFETEEEIKASGGNMEGAVFPAITVTKEFFKRYKNKYKSDTYVSFAGNAYDFAVLAGMVLLGGTSPSPLEITREFRRFSEIKGVSGKLGYRESKEFGAGYLFPVAMKTISGERIVTLK